MTQNAGAGTRRFVTLPIIPLRKRSTTRRPVRFSTRRGRCALAKKLLFDTNALIDFMDGRRPQHAEALHLVVRCIDGADLECYAAVSSLKDVYYIMRKVRGSEEKARNDIRWLADVFEPVGLLPSHVREAIDSPEPDFEDGLVRAMAEQMRADAIITRDTKAFEGSTVPHLSAREYLAYLGEAV